ncbi:MAG: radical SAM protein [bacterium]|nr:radical SAM protein [bacterium]
MKIVMLNPPYVDDFCRSARWATKSRGRVQRHPDWMLIATAVLEKAGHEILFIDGAARNLKKDQVRYLIERFGPELVVCHTTTPSIYNDIEYARMCKEHGTKTAMIGPHVTAEPEDTLKKAKGAVDIICLGEYDFTLRDIASGKKNNEIDGICYMQEEKMVRNKDREPLDVNELPFPAWKHIKPERYQDAGKLHPFLTLISGRGCPGMCTFCRDMALMTKRKLRFREPKKIVDEMEYDIKIFPQIKEIMFETDTFTAIPDHVREVCEDIIKRGLHKKVKWSCNVRTDMDLSLLPLMKKAGCRMLMIGFEFGTQKALDAVKKNITLEQSRRFSKAAAKLGFIQHGCFMIGAPGETRESARATINFAKSLPLDTVQFSGICTYPGTPLYVWAKEKGYLVPKDWTEWVGPNYEQVTLLNYPQLSKKEIDTFIDKGLKEFYLRPNQMVKMVFNMRSTADIKRKMFGVKNFFDYMFKGGRA